MISLDSRVGKAFYGSFGELTEVQKHAEKPLLEGFDAVILSGTGSGKTAAVMAPLANRYLMNRSTDNASTIVYIVPTKALANDVERRLSPPLVVLRISLILRHGDVKNRVNSNKAQVIVTTPESLDVLVSGSPHLLNDVRAVVIDEAHLLYNTQRGLQLGILMRRLERRSKLTIQVVGLSATIASPIYLWKFFRPHVNENNLAIVKVSEVRPIEALVRIERSEGDLGALLDYVDQSRHFKVLMFVDSRRIAEQLAAEIQSSSSFKNAVFVHHSSLSADNRERTEREFATRARALCMATSTLELGIDIGDVDLIILYGIRGGWESFLQRVGRGNRRGKSGKVLCISPRDKSCHWLTMLTFLTTLRLARTGGEEPPQPMALHGSVVQQILSILRERKGSYVRLADITELISPWSHLTRSTVDAIADTLVERNSCVRHGFLNRIGAGPHLYRLETLRLLWGNFPLKSREVPLKEKGREIGTVSARNLTRLKPGLRVRFAGQVWTIKNIRASGISVLPARGLSHDVEIDYAGKGIGIDPTILNAVRQILLESSWESSELAKTDKIVLNRKWKKLSQMLTEAELPYMHENEGFCYLTFAGSLVNDVICRSQRLVSYEIDDLRIWSPCPIEFHAIPKNPELLVDYAVESQVNFNEITLFQSMLPDSLLRKDLAEPWCRNPSYARILQRLGSSKPKRIESDKFRMLLA